MAREMVSEKTVARLSFYRRILEGLRADGQTHVFSHELAARAGGTATQTRRDIMTVAHAGSPQRGYDVEALIESIEVFLDGPEGQNVAIVGVGNLGRALLAYVGLRQRKLSIIAAFDRDPRTYDRVIRGVRCYPMARMAEIIHEQDIRIGVIAVPASESQFVAEGLVAAGITGILNFAPARLRVPNWVFVEDLDLTTSFEKVAYYARKSRGKRVPSNGVA